jgi:hypothetical protein
MILKNEWERKNTTNKLNLVTEERHEIPATILGSWASNRKRNLSIELFFDLFTLLKPLADADSRSRCISLCIILMTISVGPNR